MTECRALEQLKHETANGRWIERASITMLVHVLLEVLFAVLKDENKFGFGVDNIVKADDVDVFEFLHEGDLTDCCRRCSFFGIEVNLFQCDDLVGCPRSSLVKWISPINLEREENRKP